MQGIQLPNDFFQDLTNTFGKKDSKKEAISESKKTEPKAKPEAKKTEDKAEQVVESEHVCPLCESHLEAPISDEKLQEHINLVLDIINENFETDGESLDEDEELEESDESEDEKSDDDSK